LKPVFIIALVAVAMIGVMVPSVFAEDEWTFSEYQNSFQKFIENEEYEKALKINDDAHWYFGLDGDLYWYNLLLDKHRALTILSQHQEALNTIREFNQKLPSTFSEATIKANRDINIYRIYEASSLYELGKYSEAIGVAKETIVDVSREPKKYNQDGQKFALQMSYVIIEASKNKGVDGCILHCSERTEQVTTGGMGLEYTTKFKDSADSSWKTLDYPEIEKTDVSEISNEKTITSSQPPPTCGTGTEDVDGICQVIQTKEKSPKGGGCLIATATYGSELAPQVQQLRELRDNQLLQTSSGTAFMSTFNDVYYSFSPIVSDYERENPYFKEAVKIAITPMLSSLLLMENANSESEVLGMGLSVIALNLGMYLAVPAIVIVGIRKINF
jgi:tetratricopeptide (TPR) repeat protein